MLHLDKTVTSILAGAGIIGIAFRFAFQDLAANFISGVLLALQRPVRVGELIETNDHIRTVERIDLRTMELGTSKAYRSSYAARMCSRMT